MGPPAGRRPVLLLSRNEAYAVRELVMVAPLTTRIRGIPSEVPLGSEDGVSRPCVVNLDTIATIARGSLRERLTILAADKLKEVEEALHFSLGLER
jgi:mRNA interferase MazF